MFYYQENRGKSALADILPSQMEGDLLHPSYCFVAKLAKEISLVGLFYDQGTRSVSFEVKNDVFQICLILMFLYYR